jgi:hypothetical protein
MRTISFLGQLSTLALTALVAGGANAQQASTESRHGASHDLVAPDEIKWQPSPRDWTNGPPPSLGTPVPPPEIALI